jgi:hypothetical protein
MRKFRYDPTTEQVPTIGVSAETIMASAAFRRGVADARAGRSPDYDGGFALMPLKTPPANLNSSTNRQWLYERGRLFGVLAPRDLQVIMPRAKRVNPKAIKFYEQASWEDIP